MAPSLRAHLAKPEQLAMAAVIMIIGTGVAMAVRPAAPMDADSVRSVIADELSRPGSDLVPDPCSWLIGQPPGGLDGVVAFGTASLAPAALDQCALSLRVNSEATGSGWVGHFTDTGAAEAVLRQGIDDHDVLAVDRSCPSGALIVTSRLRSAGEQSHHIARGIITSRDGTVVVIDLESSSLHDETLRDGVDAVARSLSIKPAATCD